MLKPIYFKALLLGFALFVFHTNDFTLDINLGKSGKQTQEESVIIKKATTEDIEKPEASKKVNLSKKQIKDPLVAKYVERFHKVAQNEMEKYRIPASIKLAQALLETKVGTSRLATNNYNHFGMKCFSSNCKKGHCSNFTDDSHKDFFRIYDNAWESYRGHSKLLSGNPRYASLFKLKKADYKGWAHGLKKAGYATDKKYAEKLIKLIENYELYNYDK